MGLCGTWDHQLDKQLRVSWRSIPAKGYREKGGMTIRHRDHQNLHGKQVVTQADDSMMGLDAVRARNRRV